MTADIGAPEPLSYPQRQLWLIEQMEPSGGLYNEVWVLRLDGDLDPAVLQRCLNELVARHDALRSVFRTVDGEPRRYSLPRLDLDLGEPIDLTHLPASDAAELVTDFAGGLADRPYDMSAGPLIRCLLIHLAPGRHTLLIAAHHMVVDGRSHDILLAELCQLYGDLSAGRPARLPELPASYGDYVRWQLAAAGDGSWTEDLEYWRSQLDGAPRLIDLSPARLRPPVKGTQGVRSRIDCTPGLAAGVRDLARSEHTTPATVLIAAFSALLHRYTGRSDMVIGTAAGARPAAEFEGLVGFFANVLPLRLKPRASVTFRNYLREVTETSLDALDHQTLPFGLLVQDLAPDRDPSFGPLVQVVFSNGDLSSASYSSGGLSVRSEYTNRCRSRFDLLVEGQLAADTLTLWVEYDTALFTEDRIRRMGRHFENLLAAVLWNPGWPLCEVPMLTAEEHRWVTPEAAGGGPAGVAKAVLHESCALAPAYSPGPVYVVSPGHGRLAGDRQLGPRRPSGEIAYRDGSGELVPVGTRDELPDIDGLTVPVAEVRAAIAVHPEVRDAMVVVRYDLDGHAHLAAEIMATGPGVLDLGHLREHLAGLIPRYAIPADITVSGRAPTGADGPPEINAPGEDLLKPVLEAFRNGLLSADVGPDSDFFVMGGYSMLAAQIASALGSTLGIQIPLRWIFEYPTPRALSRAVAERAREWAPPKPQESPEPACAAPPPSRLIPLTSGQADIWVASRLAPNEPTFNIPVAAAISGPLRVDALSRAFDAVVARHSALHGGYHLGSGQLQQRPLAQRPVLTTVVLDSLPPDWRKTEVEQLRREEALRPFALDAEPTVRARLLTLGPQEYELLLTFHHIAMDGVALAVFVRQLVDAYHALVSGSEPTWSEPKLSWADYARWEAQWRATGQTGLVSFWGEQLRDLPLLTLPTELPRPARPGQLGDHCGHTLDHELSTELSALAARLQASPFMLTLTAFAVLVHLLAGRTDLPIGTPSENRHLPGSDELIGCSINMLVARLDLSGDPDFEELTGRVRKTVLSAYEHQGLPLTKLAQAAGCTGGSADLIRVCFDMQDIPVLDLLRCDVRWSYVSTGRARTDLTMTVLRSGDQLSLTLEYNTALWTRDWAQARLRQFAAILSAAAADPARRLSEFGNLSADTEQAAIPAADATQSPWSGKETDERSDRSPEPTAGRGTSPAAARPAAR